MQYFGSNIADGVAESWVVGEMSWVEVDGARWSCVGVDRAGWRWSNNRCKILYKILRKAAMTGYFLVKL